MRRVDFTRRNVVAGLSKQSMIINTVTGTCGKVTPKMCIRDRITFPVLDPSVRAKVRHILEVELEDTVRARIMKMDESGQ